MCFVNAKRVELGPHPALVVVCEQALFCDVVGEGEVCDSRWRLRRQNFFPQLAQVSPLASYTG